MKRIFNIGIAAFLILAFGFLSPVFAVESTTTTNTTESQTFTKRQEDRKKEFSVSLTNTEKFRLKSRCKAAQGKLSSVGQRANGLATSRSQVHANIVSHLESLVVKLKAKNVNTEELETKILNLKQKITSFNESLDTYRLAVADLVEVECQTDPDAFKAALLDARAALADTKQKAKDVKEFLKNDVKPLLVEIRKSLKSGEDN